MVEGLDQGWSGDLVEKLGRALESFLSFPTPALRRIIPRYAHVSGVHLFVFNIVRVFVRKSLAI